MPIRNKVPIGIVAPQFPPTTGGMERYAYEIACQLSERGYDVVVFTMSDNGPLNSAPFPVERVLVGDWPVDRQTLRQWQHRIGLWHVMNAAWSWVALQGSPTVVSVHGNDLLNPNAVAGFSLKRRLHLRYGSTLDYRLACWRTPRIMRRAFSDVRHVFSNSRFTENILLQKHPSCIGKSSVAYAGVGSAFLKASLLADSKRIHNQIITVCRLSEPRKNVNLVLQALALLKDRFSFDHLVIGDGTLRTSLMNLSADLGLGERVRFLGEVSDRDLIKHLSESRLFVLPASQLPTNVEGFGIVYLEANACGTPVLGVNGGGASEAIKEGISGMLIEHPSTEMLSGALEQFLSGKSVFEPQVCRDFAQGFSWERVCDRICEGYESALGQDKNVRGRFQI
jgi:glycosyltransferase involved in cell wall biosynthesis